jgi:imidazolonepropionase-like amidohydrolase
VFPDQYWNKKDFSTYRSYIAAGMSNIQILQSATMNPGILVAGEGKVGLLEAGYYADIFAFNRRRYAEGPQKLRTWTSSSGKLNKI